MSNKEEKLANLMRKLVRTIDEIQRVQGTEIKVGVFDNDSFMAGCSSGGSMPDPIAFGYLLGSLYTDEIAECMLFVGQTDGLTELQSLQLGAGLN